MGRLFTFTRKLSRLMFWVSCVAILCIVFLTTFDVISRRLGNPIDFTYEVVVYLGAIVIGFAIPQTTLDGTHVIMDFLTQRFPSSVQKTLRSITRCLAMSIFLIIGWNIIGLGSYLRSTGQASPILKIPDYPIAYGIGLCCFLECMVLCFDLLQGLKEAKQ